MDKIEILKQAIRDHIENELGGSLADKEKALKINKGDLSKIMKMKVTPSLERIFFIEEMLKVNILIINSPHPKQPKNDRSEPSSRPYKQIQEHFKDTFDDLLEAVSNKLKSAWEPPRNKYDLQIRKTMSYISVNLVPRKKDIGGIPLLTFRYDDRKQQMGIWFIAPDKFLQKRVDYPTFDLKPTGTKTTYHPWKGAGKYPMEYIMPGQPVMNVKVITPDVKRKVSLLAHHVYEIQEGL